MYLGTTFFLEQQRLNANKDEELATQPSLVVLSVSEGTEYRRWCDRDKAKQLNLSAWFA